MTSFPTSQCEACLQAVQAAQAETMMQKPLLMKLCLRLVSTSFEPMSWKSLPKLALAAMVSLPSYASDMRASTTALTQHHLSAGDVHKGTWRCTTVAVKILKVLSHDDGSHQWQ